MTCHSCFFWTSPDAYCSLCSGMPHLSRREDTRLFGVNLNRSGTWPEMGCRDEAAWIFERKYGFNRVADLNSGPTTQRVFTSLQNHKISNIGIYTSGERTKVQNPNDEIHQRTHFQSRTHEQTTWRISEKHDRWGAEKIRQVHGEAPDR